MEIIDKWNKYIDKSEETKIDINSETNEERYEGVDLNQSEIIHINKKA